MVKNESLRQWGIACLCFFLFFHSALGLQEQGTASYYSSIASIEKNEELIEVLFRNGLKVVIEERFGIPLAAVNAVIIPSAGLFSEEYAPAVADFYRGAVEADIHKLGGFAESFPLQGAVVLRAVVPSEEVRPAIEILEKIDFLEGAGSGASMPAAKSSHGREIHNAGPAEFIAITVNEFISAPEQSSDKAPDSGSRKGTVSGLVITGAVQHEIVLNYIAEVFKKSRTGMPTPEDISDPSFSPADLNGSLEYQASETELDFPVFTITYRIPPLGHPRRMQYEMIRMLAGGGLASLLRVEEEEMSLNFQHRADIVDRDNGSFLVITGAVHPDYLDKAELLVLGIMSNLGKTEIPEALVTRGKSLYFLEYLKQHESLPDRADNLTKMLLQNRISLRSDFVKNLEEVGKTSLQKAAAESLDESRAYVREFLPKGSTRNFTSETFADTVNILLPQTLLSQKKRLERLAYSELELSFQVPEKQNNFLPPKLKKSSVLRGPDIHLYEIHNTPLVRIGIYFPGGFSEEDKINAGLTEVLVSNMLQSWSREGCDSQSIYLEGMGADIEGVVHPDYFGFRATVLASNFEAVFAEMMARIREFKPSEDLISSYRNSRKYSSFLENQGMPAEKPDSIIPIGSTLEYRSVSGTNGSQEKVAPAGSWYEKISGSHPEIIIYGDVKGTSFLRGMVPRLSNSRLKKFRPARRRIQEAERIDPVIFAGPDKEMCRFIISGLSASSGREESLQLISRAQDGSGISVEWLTLVKKGYGLVSGRLTAGSGSDECVPVNFLQKMKKKGFSTREFNQSKVRAITRHYLETEDPAVMLDKIVVGVLSGKRGDFIRQHLVDLKQVRTVEVESVQEIIFGE